MNPLTTHKAKGLKIKVGRKPRSNCGCFSRMRKESVRNASRMSDAVQDPRHMRHRGRLMVLAAEINMQAKIISANARRRITHEYVMNPIAISLACPSVFSRSAVKAVIVMIAPTKMRQDIPIWISPMNFEGIRYSKYSLEAVIRAIAKF
jgi:hypothetical protein